MLGMILGALNPISAITRDIANLKIEQAKADTDEKRIHSNEQIRTLEMKRDALLASGNPRLDAWIRAGFAISVLFFHFWTSVVDKIACKWFFGTTCNTDPLSEHQMYVEIAVIGFYFLHSAIKR